MNKLSSKLYQQQQQQQNQNQQMTTDALIVNSNSHLVSDEIILQLQEQFGNTKQIYILNSSNNSLISSTSYNNTNTFPVSNNPVQYLVVDKDVDINLILQDPNIFNQAFNNNQNNVQSQQQQQQQQTQLKHNSSLTKITQNTISSTVPTSASTTIEESVQRVQAPPPKRKKFEFKFENKKNSYQDAFLRYLAGEKQPTLDIVSEQVNRKPRDNISYSSLTKSNPTNTAAIAQNVVSSPTTTSTTPAVSTIITSSLNNNITTATNDKENYYNSSRRENLMPLNNYEYRNSYKDHYDNQGVRINPAILKNLPYSPSSPITTIIPSTSKPTIYQRSNVNIQHQQIPPSKIVITKSNANSNKNLISKIADNKVVVSNSNFLSDHTYKMHDSSLSKANKLNKMNVQIDLNDNFNLNELNGQNHSQQVINDSHGINITPVVATVSVSDIASQPIVVEHQQSDLEIEEVRFLPGEFLIHKSTFSGDFENYDIWCVLNDEYLQKYEPVLLSSGERCHQSADVLAQYTQDKNEFLIVKVEEKGKTEQNNIVVGVLNEYEPKNNKVYSKILLQQTLVPEMVPISSANTTIQVSSTANIEKHNDIASNDLSITTATQQPDQSSMTITSPNQQQQQQVILVTYDDLKRTFDIFIQVLLSQYLNNEFLIKIKELNDEYFKPSIELIDTILNEKYDLVFNYLNEFLSLLTNDFKKIVKLNPLYKHLLENKPKLEILNDYQTNKKCESLIYEQEDSNDYDLTLMAQHLIKFTGHSYNLDNLQYMNINDDDMNDTISLVNSFNNNNNNNSSSSKSSSGISNDQIMPANVGQYFVCTKILNITQILHSLRHFKMIYFDLCSQKIESVKVQTNGLKEADNDCDKPNSIDENSTNTELLNYCLADNKWLLEMFEKFKQILFDVDQLLTNSTANVVSSNSTNMSKLNDYTNNHSMDIDLVDSNEIENKKLSLNNVNSKNGKTILIDDTNHKT